MTWASTIDEMVEQICHDPLEEGVIISITPVDRIPFEVYEDAPESQNDANTDTNRRW